MSELAVPTTLAGGRLDGALALLTGWSRAEVARLIDDGAVLVGGQPVVKSHRLEAGALVELLSEPPPDRPPGPEPVPIDVRFADDDLVVVSKPAGLVVHPGAGHAGGTLVNGLLERFPELSDVGDPARPGIVHRLDRDTSGLMLVARTPRTAAIDRRCGPAGRSCTRTSSHSITRRPGNVSVSRIRSRPSSRRCSTASARRQTDDFAGASGWPTRVRSTSCASVNPWRR